MTKEVGTLKELNVKPGDVVEWPGIGEYLVLNGGGVVSKVSAGLLKDGIDYPGNRFRIVSRAEATPKLWRDMTPEEKGALLLTYHEGKVIEWHHKEKDGWAPLRRPSWLPGVAYRIKPTRTKSEWSAWFTSKADGTTKFDLASCAEVERVALGDGKQFAYRVKKWVE